MKFSQSVILIVVASLYASNESAAQDLRPVRLPPTSAHVRLVNYEDVPPGVAVSSPQSGLTLADMERIALDHNPAITAAAARVEAAHGHWFQVGLRPNPVFGYSGEEIGDSDTAGKQGAFASQRFITANKLELNRAIAEQEIERAEQLWSAWRQRVLTDVRIGFYEALIAERRVTMTAELLKASEAAEKVARQLVKAKETSKVDVLQAQVEVGTIRIQLQKARHAHAAAWRRLSAVLGRPDIKPQSIAGDIESARRDIDWPNALARLLSESPEIAAAHAQLYRAQWAADRAFAERIPNVDTMFSIHRDNTTGDTVAGVEVGIPIPLFNRNQGGIAKANAELAAAEADIQRVELRLRQRLATVYRRYADARFEVGKYKKEIQPAAKESLDLVTKLYEAGESNYLALLTAQRTYFRTNLAYVESLRQLWAASLEIDGLLLIGGLGGE